MYGKMKQHLCDTLAEIKEAGLYKEERLIEATTTGGYYREAERKF